MQCSPNIAEMRVTDKNQPISREVMNMGLLMFNTVHTYSMIQTYPSLIPPFTSFECIRVQCSTNVAEMRVTDKNQPISREVMNMGLLMFNTVHTYPMIQTYPLPDPPIPLF